MTTAELFDWTAIEDVDSAEVAIKDTAGRATPMRITLAGPEHPARRSIVHARQRRLRAAMARNGRLPVSDPEEDEAEQTDLLVAATLGWSGAAVPYSPQAARALYEDPKRRWLRAQVQAALDERELFTRNSALP